MVLLQWISLGLVKLSIATVLYQLEFTVKVRHFILFKFPIKM